MSDTPLATLATYLAGEFDNQAQAAAEPAWYVHLRLWQRLIPSLSSERSHTFFLEQANIISGKPPYRQRIFQIQAAAESGQLQGQYFALKEPLKFQGAGSDAHLLSQISEADLVVLPNSGAAIQYQSVAGGYRFQSALKDDQLCSFEYGGQVRYVYLGFDIEPAIISGARASTGDTLLLKTYDKGIDPDTGQGLWGALMGPFEMVKLKSL